MKLKSGSDMRQENKHSGLWDPLKSLRRDCTDKARSSEQERRVDARALIAEEGRDKLR